MTTHQGHYRFPKKSNFRTSENGFEIWDLPWLDFIHAANRIEPGFFGSPSEDHSWWNSDVEYVERYPDAYVLHRTDGSISIIAETDHGGEVLAQAWEKVK